MSGISSIFASITPVKFHSQKPNSTAGPLTRNMAVGTFAGVVKQTKPAGLCRLAGFLIPHLFDRILCFFFSFVSSDFSGCYC